MKSYIAVALLLLCTVQAQQGTQDFVTGFFLSMRAAEKMPHAFDCVTSAASVQKIFEDFQTQFNEHPSVQLIIQLVFDIVPAIEAAADGCGAVGQEAIDYVNEIKGIVTKKSFPLDAGKALFVHRKVVAQDVSDYNDAKVAEDFLLAGMKIGEIGRIVVWGSPAE